MKAKVVVGLEMTYDEAVAVATALQAFDLDDPDVGGGDELRGFSELLADTLHLQEIVVEEDANDPED